GGLAGLGGVRGGHRPGLRGRGRPALPDGRLPARPLRGPGRPLGPRRRRRRRARPAPRRPGPGAGLRFLSLGGGGAPCRPPPVLPSRGAVPGPPPAAGAAGPADPRTRPRRPVRTGRSGPRGEDTCTPSRRRIPHLPSGRSTLASPTCDAIARSITGPTADPV